MLRLIMETFPPPGRAGRLDRLGTWMRMRKWRQWLVLSLASLVTTVVLLAVWIGVAILRGSTERDAGAVALNLVLIFFLAIVGLIILHRAAYRWFWHVDRKRAEGTLRVGGPAPAFGSEPTAPSPRIVWPWTLRVRHGFIYFVGIGTLLYAFAPYEHQLAIVRFVATHSVGRSSAGSLTMLLFGYVPLMMLAGLTMLLTWRQMRRRDAGLLDTSERLVLEAETSWLFSFGLAFAATTLLCRLAGSMIAVHL
jgi:hypothetical protein